MPPDHETVRDIRVEALRYLYARPSAAMPESAIVRAVRKAGVECEDGTLTTQLGILAAQNLVKHVPDPDMPALKSWQITGPGIAHYEHHHA